MSAVEIAIRVHFEMRSVEPLTCKQIAQRLGWPVDTVQKKLNDLLVQSYIKRRRSHDCNRPYVYTRADVPWPDDIAVQDARAELQRMAARAMQH